MDGREEILQDYEEEISRERNLSFFNLLVVYIAMAIFFMLTVPVVFVRNEIYFISRDIAELQTRKTVLLEEQQELTNKIEAMSYRYEISDPIEILENNEE